MSKRPFTTLIVVHCSATPPSMDIGREEIREWHLDRGFSDIGYHWVIRRNGDVEAGRPGGDIGAHAQGYNSLSVGLCLVGGVDGMLRPDANFTRAQYDQLESLLIGLQHAYPEATIVGHRDLPEVTKACPSFDVKAWWNN